MKFYETKNSEMIINLDEINYLEYVPMKIKYKDEYGMTHAAPPHGIIHFKRQKSLKIGEMLYSELKKVLLENKGVKINE